MAKNQAQPLLDFLDQSPTAWHAVQNMSNRLKQEGFEELLESDVWKLKQGHRYFITRNGSSICAFVVPKTAPRAAHVVATHTDSPGFKLKPNAEFRKENMILWGVEVYGGPLIASWLNRDLGVAGRIIYENQQGKINESLVRIDDAPVVLPQLAIHLDRKVNEEGVLLNKQEQLAVLAALGEKKTPYLEKKLKEQCRFKTLLGADLFLYPLEKAALVGDQKQMIASYRIDSLATVHAAFTALCDAKEAGKSDLKFFAALDNEEIGSDTAQGAGSPFVSQTLERVLLSLGQGREEYLRMAANSLCVSADLGHAMHPNYKDRHEPQHPLFMEKGIVIKFNAQHRYASDARSASKIVHLCNQLGLSHQSFVTRGDIPSGSTIGPIHACMMGMSTVDIGFAQLSMHSCRELAAVQDYQDMHTLLKAFLK